jgi:hypothetical protein
MPAVFAGVYHILPAYGIDQAVVDVVGLLRLDIRSAVTAAVLQVLVHVKLMAGWLVAQVPRRSFYVVLEVQQLPLLRAQTHVVLVAVYQQFG